MPPTPTTPPPARLNEVPYNPAHAGIKAVSTAPTPKLTAALEALAGPKPGAPAQTQTQTQAPTPANGNTKPDTKLARFTLSDDEQGNPRPTEAPAPSAPAPGDPFEPSPDETKTVNKQFRERYESLRKEYHALKTNGDSSAKELETLRVDTLKAKERLAALEPFEGKFKETQARLQEKEERLRITDFTQSEEFHASFVKPLSEASESAERWIGQLDVKLGEDGQTRKATADDFKALLRMEYGQAFEAAKGAFGPDFAGRVMDHYERVRDILLKRDDAMQNAALRSQEWLKSRHEQEAQVLQETRSAYQRIERDLLEKHRELYTPNREDAEELEAFQLGDKLAQLALEPDPTLSKEERLTIMAKTIRRAAALPVQVLRNQKLAKENADLKAKLTAYEKSEPSGRSPQSASNTNGSNKGDLKSRLTADLGKIAGRRY